MMSATKKQRGNISNELRLGIWDVYIGRAYKVHKCKLCGISDMGRNTVAGFESAHMIADKWMTDQTKLSIYYLYPSCKTCNLNCNTMCLLDYLFCRYRYRELRECIRAICTTYISDHDNLDERGRLWAGILKSLYGPDRWKAGGGLVNETKIYDMAEQEQSKWLNEREHALLIEQHEIVKEKIYLSENPTAASKVNSM